MIGKWLWHLGNYLSQQPARVTVINFVKKPYTSINTILFCISTRTKQVGHSSLKDDILDYVECKELVCGGMSIRTLSRYSRRLKSFFFIVNKWVVD